jgi:anti-sigma regulatory factor (Ser/Thr protein kinase)
MQLSIQPDPCLTRAGSPSAVVQSLCINIAADVALVADVRHSVRAALASWGVGQIADDMALMASELTSNALKHAGGEAVVRLRLRLGEGQALLEVEDGSRQRPVLRQVSPQAEKGRGLLLVAALAAEWGWRPRETGGKTVWASLALPVGCAS